MECQRLKGLHALKGTLFKMIVLIYLHANSGRIRSHNIANLYSLLPLGFDLIPVIPRRNISPLQNHTRVSCPI